MIYIKQIIELLYYIANIPIEVFGYIITLWQLLIFALIGGLFAWFIRRLFD